MAKRAKRAQRGTRQKHKEHASRAFEDTAANKKKFLKQLAHGQSPGVAAEKAGIDRSTAYHWRQNDPAFEVAWKEAKEIAADRAETFIYNAGKKDWRAAERYLQASGRPEWRKSEDGPRQINNYVANISIADQLKRLQRLGLPAPVIDSDDVDEDELTRENRSSRSDNGRR